MSFTEGENVGPYRIMEKLGQGGMATVYKAYHAALDRYVALKVLHPAFHEDETFIGRFQREARVVAKLEHTSIVPIYDYAKQDDRPYLVMKYIEGETLKARLSRGPLSAAEITHVVDAVGSALAYAHTEGILHRDIKPSNVLIDEDGHMYLADFGLARIAQAGESTLSVDSIMGTPQYISPEQARGDKDLDLGTDIYSFGVMLYEIIVGQVPFSADTPFSIIHDHIFTPLPLPRSINKDVPESVERVLLKALAKERVDRYEDVTEMSQAFKDAWASAGVPMQGTALTLVGATVKQTGKVGKTKLSSDSSKTAIGKEPKKKRSRWPWVAAIVLMTICCIFVIVVTQQDDNDPLTDQAPAALTQVVDAPLETIPTRRGPPDTPEGSSGMSPELRNAKRLADNNPDDPAAQLDLALAFWDAGRERQAVLTLDIAAKLANEDVTFLIEAGDQFRERQAWIGSAAMYLRAQKSAGIGGEIPEDVEMNFHQAVYMAAISPDIEVAYPIIDEIMRVDQPIGLVAQARHEFYGGNIDEAQVLLNKVGTLVPNMHEANLLEGEMAIIEQRFEVAKLILLPLTANLEVPPWIRAMAEDYINRIP